MFLSVWVSLAVLLLCQILQRVYSSFMFSWSIIYSVTCCIWRSMTLRSLILSTVYVLFNLVSLDDLNWMYINSLHWISFQSSNRDAKDLFDLRIPKILLQVTKCPNGFEAVNTSSNTTKCHRNLRPNCCTPTGICWSPGNKLRRCLPVCAMFACWSCSFLLFLACLNNSHDGMMALLHILQSIVFPPCSSYLCLDVEEVAPGWSSCPCRTNLWDIQWWSVYISQLMVSQCDKDTIFLEAIESLQNLDCHDHVLREARPSWIHAAAYSNLQTTSVCTPQQLLSLPVAYPHLVYFELPASAHVWYCSNSQNITVREFILLVRAASNIFKKCWQCWHYFHWFGAAYLCNCLDPPFLASSATATSASTKALSSSSPDAKQLTSFLMKWIPSWQLTIWQYKKTSKNSSCTLVFSYFILRYFIIPLTHS